MLEIDSGKEISVIPEQPENAALPIYVTEFGIVIEDRAEQPEKALLTIPFVPSLMTIFVLAGIAPLYL